jgi:polysaccharide pyruvyl transferase WcaK-like protein
VGLRDSLGHLLKFTALTGDPERVKAVHNIEAIRPFDRRRPWRILQGFREVRRADGLFITGGTPLYDDTKQMVLLASLVLWARLWGTPVVIFGVSLRPTEKTIPRVCVRLIGMLCAYWGVRELDSKARSETLLSRNHRAKVQILPDPASQIRTRGPERLQAFADKESIPISDPWVVICPRSFSAARSFKEHHYGRDHTQNQLERYQEVLYELTRWLVGDLGYRAIFFPMHIHAPDDDRVVGYDVVRTISDQAILERTHVVAAQYGPLIAKAVFGHARYVIAVRFHAAVLATSSGTPVITIGYDRKNDAIMEFMGLGAYAHAIRNVDHAALKRSVVDLEVNHEVIRSEIQARNEALRTIYQKETRHILQIIQHRRRER